MKSINTNNINSELLIVVFLFLYIGFIFYSIALSNIFLGIGVFIFLLAWIRNNIQLDFSSLRILLFLVLVIPFLLTLISVLHSEDLANGMKSIRLRIPISIITFILVFMKIKDKTIKKGISVFISLTLFATVFTLIRALRFVGEEILLQPDFTFFITPIQHPYFGIYLLIAFVSVIEFRLIEHKTLKFLILLLLITGMVISTSRLTYFLLFSIVIFYSFIGFPKKKSIIILISLVVISSLFISANNDILSKFKTSLNYQHSPRLKLWNNAIKVIENSENKFLGIGIGDYYKTKEDPYFFKDNNKGLYGYDPHSQFFDFYITTGYIGISIMLIFFLFGIKKVLEQKRFAIIVFLIIFAFSLTESILNRQYGVQLYSIFIPLILKENFKRSK